MTDHVFDTSNHVDLYDAWETIVVDEGIVVVCAAFETSKTGSIRVEVRTSMDGDEAYAGSSMTPSDALRLAQTLTRYASQATDGGAA